MDALAQLVADGHLLAGTRLRQHRQLHGRALALRHVNDTRRLEDPIPPGGIGLEVQADTVNDHAGAVGIGLGVDADLHRHRSLHARDVRGDDDLPVRDGMDRAVRVLQRGAPQAEVVDHAFDPGDAHHVALAVLVLEHDEDAGKPVAHEGLRTEADGDPDDAETGHGRPDVDPEHAERHQHRDDRDHAAGDLHDQPANGLDTAFELGGRENAGARLLVGMLEQVAHADADQGAQDEERDERGDRDQCQLQDDLGRRWQGRQVEHGPHGNKRPWGTEDCSGAVLPGAADLAHHRSRMWTGRTTCLGQAAIWARSTKQMTSNQRRPGFRLPWASESEAAEAQAADVAAADHATGAAGDATATADAVPPADGVDVKAPAADAPAATSSPDAPATDAPATDAPAAAAKAGEPEPDPARSATEPAAPAAPGAVAAVGTAESSAGFMRDLVEAMRRVAEETRQSSLSDLRTTAEERVRGLEADAERRREELKATAETDVAGVGEWSNSETERIKQEAEQRIVARRAQLDQQLAAETTRAEAEAKTLRDRVEAYERELDAYHAQLSDIADPAAFAAAAKRMPPPPRLADTSDAAPSPAADHAPSPAETPAERHAPSSNATAPASDVHPAEEEVLAARLAELDATLKPTADAPSSTNGAAAPVQAGSGEPTSTEILVKGLGSFGAITGFRQALASVDGIEGVSLSLGPTGEFVFRAIHPTGFDVAVAIAKLEGDAATIEHQPEGALRVTLDRAR